MKKILFSMVAMLMIAATATVFTSCSDDDEDTFVVVSVGVKGLSFSSSDSAEETALMTYMSEVESAYKSALGMTTDNTLILKNVDYKTTCTEKKTKFENASLPTPPSFSRSTYSFTYELTASKGSGAQETLATKTFTGE